MIVKLAWPPARLSPNARSHWAVKSRAVGEYRRAAFYEAKRIGLSALDAPSVSVRITFNPPDRRARDLDNMLASIKAGLDGIKDAIGIDDSKWSLEIRKGEPVNGGQVLVEVAR